MKNILFLLLLTNTCFAKTYAVIVGIEEYDGTVSNLTASVNDAQRMYDYLARNNAPDNLILLLNSQATKQNILNAMQIYKKAGADDTILFYFSGHGAPHLFCTYNFSHGKFALWHTEVKNAFKQSKAKVKLCIADACNSGSIKLSQKPPATSSTESNLIVFMSSRADQLSAENPFYRAGYFTAFLIKGLDGHADTNQDRKVSAYELFSYVKENVNRLSGGEQTPTMFGQFNKNLTISKY